jgi:hypothetical protein
MRMLPRREAGDSGEERHSSISPVTDRVPRTLSSLAVRKASQLLDCLMIRRHDREAHRLSTDTDRVDPTRRDPRL